MIHTIAEIADATGLTAVGDKSLKIARPAEPQHAAEDDLALAMSPDYEEALRASPARAAVLWDGADWQAMGLASALFAPVSLTTVWAYAFASALFALGSFTTVWADAFASALFALSSFTTVWADAFASALFCWRGRKAITL